MKTWTRSQEFGEWTAADAADVEQLGLVEQKQEGTKNGSLQNAENWSYFCRQTTIETVAMFLSERTDQIHASAALSRPNLDCSLDSKISWSTQSKAALRSNRASKVTLSSIVVKTSDKTFSNAVSVEWWLL